MIIKCPECSSLYNIPNSSINTNGRFVRCNGCEYEWVATALDDVSEVVNNVEKKDLVENSTYNNAEPIQLKLTGFLPNEVRQKSSNGYHNNGYSKYIAIVFAIIFITACAAYYCFLNRLVLQSSIENLVSEFKDSRLDSNGVSMKGLEIVKIKRSGLGLSISVHNETAYDKLIGYIRVICYDANMTKIYENVLLLHIILNPSSDEVIEYDISGVPEETGYISIDTGSHIKANQDSMSAVYKHISLP